MVWMRQPLKGSDSAKTLSEVITALEQKQCQAEALTEESIAATLREVGSTLNARQVLIEVRSRTSLAESRKAIKSEFIKVLGLICSMIGAGLLLSYFCHPDVAHDVARAPISSSASVNSSVSVSSPSSVTAAMDAAGESKPVTITITAVGADTSLDATGKNVSIMGSDCKVMLSGHALDLKVQGNNNSVACDELDNLSLFGSNNVVHYQFLYHDGHDEGTNNIVDPYGPGDTDLPRTDLPRKNLP